MPFPEPGDLIPPFTAMATQGLAFSDKDLQGRITVLYFYPKDDTPGCTTEGQDFRDHLTAFQEQGAQVVGISRDSLASHEKFCTKYNLPFPLISDGDEALCNLFGVLKEKNMYGRKVMGIERSTFLIDATGRVARVWRKVKVEGHVPEVLDAVKALRQEGDA
ncbi:MAG TPA: peroxiredoxin [Candidatus Acidoferrales bacterium]|nr:peroxiredoxin [Candidatus Acidoferrales bacterium]